MTHYIPIAARINDTELKAWQQALAAHLPGTQVVPIADLPEKRGHTVAIVANPDPDDLLHLPDLRWVQSLWAGVERIVAEPKLAHIGIVRLIDPQLAETMAEAVLAWTLYLHRDMPAYRQLQAKQVWQQCPYIPAEERRVSILGLGKLGAVAATRLQANGFSVSGWARQPKTLQNIQCFSGSEGLTEMLGETDILVNLLPLTEDTKGLINRTFLEQLPAGASLINFGRGATIDTPALTTALSNRHISHAVLDVFEEEPLPTASSLWQHPHVTVLPHISAPTTIDTAAKVAAQNILAYVRTGTLPPFVDRKRGY